MDDFDNWISVEEEVRGVVRRVEQRGREIGRKGGISLPSLSPVFALRMQSG